MTARDARGALLLALAPLACTSQVLPNSTTTPLGPGGGTAYSTDGLFSLIVPPNALAGPVDVVIETDTTSPRAGQLGAAYRVLPADLRFTEPATARRRLEAEAIRDACLAVSGRLAPTTGGPAFTDVTTPRRSLYLMAARTGAKTSEFGALFDAADCCSIVEARKESIVAPQALFLLNDPFVLDLADALAARVIAELPEGDLQPRLERLHGLLFGRLPTAEELAIAEQFLTASADGEGWARLCHLLLCTNEFVHVD
jgi:hypothetical protein